MKVFLLAFVSFFFLAFSAYTQVDQTVADSTKMAKRKANPIYGFINFTSLLEYYGSANFGVQKEINRHDYISLETGYIFGINNYFLGFNGQGRTDPITNERGFKLLFEYRYKFSEDEIDFVESAFISISPYFYFVNYKSELIAGYECNDQFGGCGFYRIYRLNTNRIIPGFYFNVGREFDLDDLKMAFSVGLGLRYVANFNKIPKVPKVDRLYLKGAEREDIPEGFMTNLRFSYILYIKYR